MTTRADAIAAAGAVMAAARAERDQLAAEGGPMAVAEAAWRPGGMPKAEIARVYAGLQAEARARRDATRKPGAA
jgi:hypothetical protein